MNTTISYGMTLPETENKTICSTLLQDEDKYDHIETVMFHHGHLNFLVKSRYALHDPGARGRREGVTQISDQYGVTGIELCTYS